MRVVFYEVDDGVNVYAYLFGGRYRMCDPSGNRMEFICSCSVCWFLEVSGLPKTQRAPDASHLLVSSWSPVYALKVCSF